MESVLLQGRAGCVLLCAMELKDNGRKGKQHTAGMEGWSRSCSRVELVVCYCVPWS